jgi:hypothetical protein
MLPKTHLIQEAHLKFPISIIRNPRDSIKSMIAMDLHYNKDYKFEIGGLTKFYIDINNYLIDNQSLLIKYDDLIKNPNEVAKVLCLFLGNSIENVLYEDVLVDKQEYNHLVSSKSSDAYSKVCISDDDLVEANLSYLEVLSKCISISSPE